MNEHLSHFLDELHAEGVAHDAAQPDRLLKHRNLEPPSAALLGLVIRITGARHVLEIGTANGYSAIWLADAVSDTDGQVVSVDTGVSDLARNNMALANAVQPGLAKRVDFRREDGGAYLARLADGSIDLLFLDAERVEYPSWWPHPIRVLRSGGVLAIDNVLSHPDEVAPFLTLLADDSKLFGITIDVGKGMYVGWRRA